MKTSANRLFALLSLVLLMVSMLAACKTDTPPHGDTADTADDRSKLVAGYDAFSGQFNPFFARTSCDQDIVAVTTVPLLDTDREGNVILKGKTGETAAYNGTDYRYEGIADCTVTPQEDSTTVYDFALRHDVTFSDGTPLTADDVIFSMYVLADPSYDGASSFYTLPIAGMTEYRAGVESAVYQKYSQLADTLWAAGPNPTKFEGFTKEQHAAYWGEALTVAGDMFVDEILRYCLSHYASYLPNCGNNEVALGMYAWGYATLNEDGTLTDWENNVYDLVSTFPTKADYWQLILKAHNHDLSENGVGRDAAATPLADLLKKAFIAIEGPKDESSGGPVRSIKGIEKTGEFSLKVTMTATDVAAVYALGIPVAPLHYYGVKEAYDYDKAQFGFTKGDLSTVRAKTAAPLGAGPYVFSDYQDGIVTLTANQTYYKGCPKIGTLQFKEVDAADKLTGIIDGTLDVTAPDLTAAIAEAIAEENGGALSGDVITTTAVDTCGYGYLGINADGVKVGDDAASTASKNLRKAFATLFAAYRDTAVSSYYNGRAHVIQYPISNTSWAAPQPSDADYKTAYSHGVDGAPIYTEDMSETERQAAALTAATEFLKAAGYTWDVGTARFTAAPLGAKLTYHCIIAANGTGDHPNYAVLKAAATALQTVGITLDIQDVSSTESLYTALAAGSCEMWSAAWTATPDPDMYPIYHSANIRGQGGTDLNHYAIADQELDRRILEARTSTDRAFRKATYKTCLDIVLDWGVEIPVYQRQDILVFSTARVNIKTQTPDTTPFWSWLKGIETLEMNP